MSRKAAMSSLFPGLAAGPPQLGKSSTSQQQGGMSNGGSDPSGPAELSPAQLHFQRLLAGTSPTNSGPGTTTTATQQAKGDVGRSGGSVSSINSSSDNMSVTSFPRKRFDPDESSAMTLPVTPITMVKNEQFQHTIGARVAASSSFICYTVKGGVRAIHTDSVKTALLRSHTEPVHEIKFCPKLNELCGTCAADGLAIVYELKYDDVQEKVLYREAIRLRLEEEGEYFRSMEWHPTAQGRFAVAHGNEVSLVELTPKLWQMQQENQGAGIDATIARMAYLSSSGNSVCSISFSKSGKYLFSGSDNGMLSVWSLEDLVDGDNDTSDDASPLPKVTEFKAFDSEVSYVRSISEDIIVAFSSTANAIRVWKKNNKGTFSIVEEVKINAKKQIVKVDSTGHFIIAADAEQSYLLCFRIDGQSGKIGLPGQFQLDCPVLSFSTRPIGGGKEEILCQQTKCFAYHVFDPVMFQPGLKDFTLATSAAPSPVSASSSSATNELTRKGSDLITPAQLSLKEKQQQQQQQRQAPPSPPHMEAQATAVPIPTATKLVESGANAAVGGGDIDALLASHMDRLYERLRQDAEVRLERDIERQKSLLKVLSASLSKIPEDVDEAVRDALEDDQLVSGIAKSFATQVGPIIANAIQNTAAASMNANLTQVAQQVAKHVQDPVKDAFVRTFKDSLVPAFEAGCNNMIMQYQNASNRATQQQASGKSNNLEMEKRLNALQSQQIVLADTLARIEASLANLSAMGGGNLSNNNNGGGFDPIRKRGASAPPLIPGNTGPLPQSPVFQEILGFINAQDYEAAFLKALCESDLELVVATCKVVDPETVFQGNHASLLSQRVLLSLMQQLSVDLSSDTALKLQWMQRAGLALDPNNQDIRTHVANLTTRVLHNMDNQRTQFEQGQGTYPNKSLFEMCYNIVKSRANL